MAKLFEIIDIPKHNEDYWLIDFCERFDYSLPIDIMNSVFLVRDEQLEDWEWLCEKYRISYKENDNPQTEQIVGTYPRRSENSAFNF